MKIKSSKLQERILITGFELNQLILLKLNWSVVH